MKKVGVITVSRSDYGIYRPVLRRIQEDPELSLHLIVSGMHLSPEFGLSVSEIQRDGFPIGDTIEMLLSSDSSEGVAKSMGLGIIGFAQSYSRFQPDLLLVLGDRFEMHAAVVAALPFRIPIAHIHGGESTEGLIDEALRHSITKMSHIHFVSTEAYARRVIQMGEAPWRVVVSGSPALDNVRTLQLLTREELEEAHGFRLAEAPLLVTYHPVTLEYEDTESHLNELMTALSEVDYSVIFTYPNADMRGRLIIERIRQFTEQHERAVAVPSLGTQAYYSLMAQSAAMVGNSSSGIIEAASFKLPVVNIGNRQRGRIRSQNVIDVDYDHRSIVTGINRATSPEFRRSLVDLVNPYGDGHAADRIVSTIKSTLPREGLIVKEFHDISRCDQCG